MLGFNNLQIEHHIKDDELTINPKPFWIYYIGFLYLLAFFILIIVLSLSSGIIFSIIITSFVLLSLYSQMTMNFQRGTIKNSDTHLEISRKLLFFNRKSKILKSAIQEIKHRKDLRGRFLDDGDYPKSFFNWLHLYSQIQIIQNDKHLVFAYDISDPKAQKVLRVLNEMLK